jgi:hypothetical protein
VLALSISAFWTSLPPHRAHRVPGVTLSARVPRVSVVDDRTATGLGLAARPVGKGSVAGSGSWNRQAGSAKCEWWVPPRALGFGENDSM